MKTINIWMLGAVLFSGLMSCEMKEEIFGKGIPEETGYLTLDVNAGSSVSMETKGRTDQKENFPLVIKALDFELTKSYLSYAKFKEENANGVIELPVGKYEVEAHSPGDFLEKMDAPYYGGVEKTEITAGVENSTNVKCKIQNVKIAMIFTAEFKNHYSEWSITVDDKSGHLDVYTQENPDPTPVYWKIPAEKDRIWVTGTATVKETNEEIRIDQTFIKKESPDFTEGDSPYFVGGDGLAISLAPANEVSLDKDDIVITVNGFKQETNESIDIEVETGAGEKPEPPTPPVPGGGPTIMIPQELYTLPADDKANADAVITSNANLLSVRVQITGGNVGFSSIVESMGLSDFDLMTVETDNATLAGILTNMEVAFPSAEDKEYTFPVGKFFTFFSPIGVTTSPEGHVFNITVTDVEGKSATGKLSVKVTE